MLATSPNQVGLQILYSTSGTLVILFIQQTCLNIARISVFHLFTECMNGLFHKITECGIKYGVTKTIEKLL